MTLLVALIRLIRRLRALVSLSSENYCLCIISCLLRARYAWQRNGSSTGWFMPLFGVFLTFTFDESRERSDRDACPGVLIPIRLLCGTQLDLLKQGLYAVLLDKR